MAGELILLVDDDKALGRLYSDMLFAKGYQVRLAENVETALENLAQATPALIVLDIMMPEIDGIEGCRRIRDAHSGDIPILFVTALDDIDIAISCFDAGGSDYITKQSALDDVLERIELWLSTEGAEERVELTAESRELLEALGSL
ncbi:MAG TPA: response regulator [Alphaproteobacteria bacterium]|jgi:DNA-binding response OmpR family regulator|nr:response regulator [Alphaproteobacteria bacterium]